MKQLFLFSAILISINLPAQIEFDKYFKDNPSNLVDHHLDSFNQFIEIHIPYYVLHFLILLESIFSIFA